MSYVQNRARPGRAGGLALAIGAALAAASAFSAAQAQTSRTVTIVQTRGGVPFPHPGWATRNFGQTTTITTIQRSEPDVARRAVIGGVTPVDQLPVVMGIRRTPVAPPTVYRIEGPRTAMHRADEERMRQVNPGARVITPNDLSLTRETRRRYAIPGEARAPELRRRSVAASQGVVMPQVIIVRPSRTY